MGKSSKIAKLRQDKFYKLAKQAGYRSRAAFKLIQLNRKFGFLDGARVLVDLCAAPGGWLQVASSIMPVSSVIVGVDLVPIKPIHNVITLIGDITAPSCCTNIENELQGWKADVVLHDGAPNLGQGWLSDSFGQAQLTLSAIKLMTQILGDNGWFVTKIFRSKDYLNITKVLGTLFKHIHSTKPMASRRESAEIFVVCQEFIGKKAVDSSILDFNTVFKEEVIKPKVTLKKLVSVKRNKGGYDEDTPASMHLQVPVMDFILSSQPLELLAGAASIVFDKDDKSLKITIPEEIQEYFKDLKVLGLKELKALLSWRKLAMKKLAIKPAVESLEKSPEKRPEEVEADEISEAQKREKQNDKKELKKSRKYERILKTKSKKAAKAISASYDDNNEDGLFSLSSLKNVSDLNKLLVSDKSADVYSSDPKPFVDDESEHQLDTLHNKISNVKNKYAKEFSENPLILKDASFSESDEMDDAVEADICHLSSRNSKIKPDDPKKSIASKTFDSEESEVENNSMPAISMQPNKVLSPEELALGAHIHNSKKNKKRLIENSYNKWTRPEGEDLPIWFKQYEDTHIIRTLPITKEEVEFYRQKQRTLESQPTKKVLEAKARQKKKKIRILEQTNARAAKLLDGETALDTDKIDQLKSMYKNAKKKLNARPKRKLIVAKKSLATGRRYAKPKGIKGPVRIVDRRMKKDKPKENSYRKSKPRSKSRMRKRR